MTPFVAELIGTMLLVLLGNGVVANVVLTGTKGNGSGWIVVAAGWGFAVFTAVLCVAEVSGAHLNPAVTIGLAIAGEFEWARSPGYILAQMLGGFLGACLVFVCYYSHYGKTSDGDAKLATFCTAPAVRSLPINFVCEAVATFVLIYAVLMTRGVTVAMPGSVGQTTDVGLGAMGAIPVGLVVFAIGLCLGGPTGYAINPARDFAPRLAHAILPIPAKRDGDWGYAAIPILGPLAGAALAAALALTFAGAT